MAKLNTHPARLLGFASLEHIETMQATLAKVPGPALQIHRGPTIAALLQDEPATPMLRRGKKAMLAGLQTVHRRLEIACQLGPFLPADPSCASVARHRLETLLNQSWTSITQALAEHGSSQQWDVVLRWPAETILAEHKAELAAIAPTGQAALAEAVASILRAEHARRQLVLSTALNRAVLAMATGGIVGTETEIAITVLVPRAGEAAIETALCTIPDDQVTGASVDLRGPMPPVSFSAVRVIRVEQGDIARSWRILQLPDRADATLLHQQWRMMAAAAHPDRHVNAATSTPASTPASTTASTTAFSDITEAYRLLRPLLRAEAQTLRALLHSPGYRLELLAPTSVAHPIPEAVA